jgi:hypothetical protein
MNLRVPGDVSHNDAIGNEKTRSDNRSMTITRIDSSIGAFQIALNRASVQDGGLF